MVVETEQSFVSMSEIRSSSAQVREAQAPAQLAFRGGFFHSRLRGLSRGGGLRSRRVHQDCRLLQVSMGGYMTPVTAAQTCRALLATRSVSRNACILLSGACLPINSVYINPILDSDAGCCSPRLSKVHFEPCPRNVEAEQAQEIACEEGEERGEEELAPRDKW